MLPPHEPRRPRPAPRRPPPYHRACRKAPHGRRHPLPYAFAKANTLLLEDDGERLRCGRRDAPLPALSEVLRLYDDRRARARGRAALANRIAAAYAGGESSAPPRWSARSKARST